MSLNDIWPLFPITVSCYSEELDDEGQDNIIAALEHHDRVSEINLRYYAKFSAVTQKPFPVLADLLLSSIDEIAPVLHEEFLGGSAPCLERFFLSNIAISSIPQTCYACHSLVRSFPWEYPDHWIHFTQGDGQLSGHLTQSRVAFY